MKLKRNLILSLLGGAMLALPMTAPAFAQSPDSIDSNYIKPVDWWWDHYRGDRDGYANHGWHQGILRIWRQAVCLRSRTQSPGPGVARSEHGASCRGSRRRSGSRRGSSSLLQPGVTVIERLAS